MSSLPKGAAQAKEGEEEEEPDAEGAPSPGSVETREAKGRASRIPREPVEKQTARELFAYIVEQGKKDYQVQRYKGLGEMTATQLWETTMDPERRTLLQREARRHCRDRGDLYHADGRRRGSAAQVHRGQRAGREEPGYLTKAASQRRFAT